MRWEGRPLSAPDHARWARGTETRHHETRAFTGIKVQEDAILPVRVQNRNFKYLEKDKFAIFSVFPQRWYCRYPLPFVR